MTLNITATYGNIVTQVSDRRMTDPASGRIVDDEANKAIVVACQDALLTITFTGLGKVGDKRMDCWLVESLADAGMAELDAGRLVAHIAEAATDWFKTFPAGWSKTAHIFSVAGWQWVNGNAIPRLWYVANTGQRDLSGTPQVEESFTETPLKIRNRFIAMGWLPAFTRGVRRRMIARLRRAADIDSIEHTLVIAIREAGIQPSSAGVIGQNCMAVSLSSSRDARSTYHSPSASIQTVGPHILWYSGGRSVIVEDPAVFPGGLYRVAFGGAPAQFTLELTDSEAGPNSRAIPFGKFGFTGNIGLRDAKHRTGDPIQEVTLVNSIEPKVGGF